MDPYLRCEELEDGERFCWAWWLGWVRCVAFQGNGEEAELVGEQALRRRWGVRPSSAQSSPLLEPP